MRRIAPPEPGEYPPYANLYIERVPRDGRLLEYLAQAGRALAGVVQGLPDATLLHRYAPGKWTIKETLVHLIDDERIYTYRALRFARGDETPLPGFDQDPFAIASQANDRPLDDILAEHAAVREATIALYRGVPEDTLQRSGLGDGKRATVRALGYHIVGHEAHHLALIEERYLGRAAATEIFR